MNTRNIITICITILLICGSFAYGQKKPTTQNRDLRKPTPTPTPTPNKEIKTPTPVLNEPTNSESKDRKKIVIVLDFTNVSLQCRDEIYGKNVATQLSTAFSKTGAYKVIEKQRIDDIFKEIGVSLDERNDPETAAKVGKVVAANTVVLGTITECSPDTKIMNVVFGKMVQYSVKVSLSIRLVDINTAEVMDAVSIGETSSDRSGCIKGLCSETKITPDLQIKLFNSAVEKAVNKSVIQLTSIIDGKTVIKGEKIEETVKTPVSSRTSSISIPQTKIISVAKVATVVGAKIYITGLGKNTKIGDLFSVIRGVEIKNPDTGETIDFDGKEIAQVEITEVRENTVVAKIIKGAGIRAKDFVKPLE